MNAEREKYPLLLHPYIRKAVWGSEAWILSDRQGCESVIDNGELKSAGLSRALLSWGLCELPILIKIISAASELSVQVHPDDEYAKTLGQPCGKTEIWYVTEAEPGASVYLGLTRSVNADEMRRRIEDGSIMGLLRKYSAVRGNIFFIPAGTIHALGGGITVAEVQQSSDTTFRLYDYGRPGEDGKPRMLHIEEALSCANLSDKVARPFIYAEERSFFADLGHFKVTVLDIEDPVGLSVDESSFLSVTVLDGQCQTNCAANGILQAGSSLFIPNGYGKAEFSGKCRIMMASV